MKVFGLEMKKLEWHRRRRWTRWSAIPRPPRRDEPDSIPWILRLFSFCCDRVDRWKWTQIKEKSHITAERWQIVLFPWQQNYRNLHRPIFASKINYFAKLTQLTLAIQRLRFRSNSFCFSISLDPWTCAVSCVYATFIPTCFCHNCTTNWKLDKSKVKDLHTCKQLVEPKPPSATVSPQQSAIMN